MNRVLLPSLLAATLLTTACRAPADTSDDGSLENYFGHGSVVVTADDGQRHEFEVYLATNYEQRRRGLMFVRDLPAMTGMLFIYDEPEILSMWMKNTYISLDMVFARADGTVATVIHDTQPLSLTSQAATEPVTTVLELNAGTARRLNIGSQSRIDWQAEN